MITFKMVVNSIAASAFGVFVVFGPAMAADFPTREIKLVVPWNVGGSNDISARLISKILADEGITVVVDNVAGATGTIGMTKVANAEPDGLHHWYGYELYYGNDCAGLNSTQE